MGEGVIVPMSIGTRATQILAASGADFSLHTYDYDPRADRIGLQAAEALGVAPSRLLKTLMIRVDGRPACALIPSDRELSMKRAAQALGGKHADMMTPADAQRSTGYVVGGISPFGQRRLVPTVIDPSALEHERVLVNGGRRGLQVGLAARELQGLLDARVAALTT